MEGGCECGGGVEQEEVQGKYETDMTEKKTFIHEITKEGIKDNYIKKDYAFSTSFYMLHRDNKVGSCHFKKYST